MEEWTTIESDPAVFTELITRMGAKDVEVDEVYVMDTATLNSLRPIYGLIFLFKWQKEEDRRPTVSFEEHYGKVFFAKQVITNACATQALLAILLNSPEIEIGPELQSLKEFTSEFDPDLKGQAISNSDSIRTAHNSFRAAVPVIHEASKDDEKTGEAFHFIAYLPINGELYELDGLKSGPIHLGPCTDEDWLEKVQPGIQERITRYSQSEIRFNLLAIVKDRRKVLKEQLEELDSQMQEDNQWQKDELASRLADEEAKYERWHRENVRRKHNYFPFVFNLLRVLGEEGKLQPLIDIAQTPLKKPENAS